MFKTLLSGEIAITQQLHSNNSVCVSLNDIPGRYPIIYTSLYTGRPSVATKLATQSKFELSSYIACNGFHARCEKN
jgi:hypothetical protein